MQNLYLIGYMYSGKSTVGRKLAKDLNWDFLDLDQEIEQKYKISVEEIFIKYGETVFRKMEKECLVATFKKSRCVVSLGGGTPCYEDNMELIKLNGISIYLKMDYRSILDRHANSKRQRPLLEGITEFELPAFVQKHLSEREIYYNQSDICMRGESLDISLLIKAIRSLPSFQQ